MSSELPTGHPKIPDNALGSGCPFLNFSKNKINPSLDIPIISYNLEYVSPYWSFFSSTLSYPLYLLNALYHVDQAHYDKIHKTEISLVYFEWSNLNEVGNQKFHEKNFEEALEYYEKSLACLIWLNKKKEEEETSKEEEGRKRNEEKEKDIKKEEERDGKEKEMGIRRRKEGEIEGRDDKKIKEEEKREQEGGRKRFWRRWKKKEEGIKSENILKELLLQEKEMEDEYSEFITLADDDNLELNILIGEKEDLSLLGSLILNSLLNIITTYLSMRCYGQALRALDDFEAFVKGEGIWKNASNYSVDLTAKVSSLPSLFYFKKSLALSSNLEANSSDMLLAQELAAQAIQVKQMESLFKEENKKLNNLVGLGEADIMYREAGKRAERRRKEEEEKKRSIYLELCWREKEFEAYEEEHGVKNGRIMEEYLIEKNFDLADIQEGRMEIEIVEKILKKLRKFLNYKDIMTPTQLSYISNEYVKVRGIYLEMKFLNNLDFNTLLEDECFKKAVEETRINVKGNYKRLRKITTDKIQEIFGKSRFNYEILKLSLESYIKAKTKDKEEHKDSEKGSFTLRMPKINSKGNFVAVLAVIMILGLIAIFLSKNIGFNVLKK